jgi:hypothetical protein
MKKYLLLKSLTVILASVMMLQIVLWYAQTGYLLVYSYGDETFQFSESASYHKPVMEL